MVEVEKGEEKLIGGGGGRGGGRGAGEQAKVVGRREVEDERKFRV